MHKISRHDVNIYTQDSKPERYKVIALIESQAESTLGSQSAQNRNMDRLKKMAAKMGANGIILLDTDHTRSWGDSFIIIKGQAIYYY